MDIVDAQVHANMLGSEVTVAIMDALGRTARQILNWPAPEQLFDTSER